MRLAIVFPGQGDQHPGMLPWLAEDALVRTTCARLGIADWRERLADPAWAHVNAHAQVLLTGLALAAWGQIAARLPPPCAVAGYSVGELAAFSAAGVFDAACALQCAGLRAHAMDRCARDSPGALAGIVGLGEAAIRALCEETGVAVAIRNDAESVVLGGPEERLERAALIAGRAGARVTRLAVGVASHTPWMRQATEDFAQVLSSQPLDTPRLVLFSNAAGRVRDATVAARALAAQISQPVRWDECMEAIDERRPDRVLEIGPGQALARLWNRRFPDVPARSCDDFRSAEAVVAWAAGSAS